MVNENAGKVYEPVQVWDRKLVRSVLRNQIIKKNGFHKVNPTMSAVFKEMQRINKEGNING